MSQPNNETESARRIILYPKTKPTVPRAMIVRAVKKIKAARESEAAARRISMSSVRAGRKP